MTVTARLAELGFHRHADKAQWWVWREEGKHGPISVTVKLDEKDIVYNFQAADHTRAFEIYHQASKLLRKGT